jgi:hypothetical protein
MCHVCPAVQGLCNGLAVATLSAPHHPPRLMLAKVPDSSSSSSSWQWAPVTALDADLSSLPLAADVLSNMRCEVLDLKATCGDDSLPMQAVVQVGHCDCMLLRVGGCVGTSGFSQLTNTLHTT